MGGAKTFGRMFVRWLVLGGVVRLCCQCVCCVVLSMGAPMGWGVACGGTPLGSIPRVYFWLPCFVIVIRGRGCRSTVVLGIPHSVPPVLEQAGVFSGRGPPVLPTLGVRVC